MECRLGFGKEKLKVEIDDDNLIGVLNANNVAIDKTGADEVKRALNNPIGSKALCDIVKPDEKIVIITSDITRPMPSKVVLPPVLKELSDAGVRDEDITIVLALGSHRKHTEEEKKYLVGEEVYNRIKTVDSDDKDFVHFGTTKNGTPIDITRVVAEADRRICLGNIEYHYFAGYSGGAKAIMPGVSTRAAIQVNHKRMVDELSHAGNLNTNPVRMDIEDTIECVPIDFILNVVLNEQKEIIKAVAGHYIQAHREGCNFLDSLYKIKLKEKADIVITSAGGYPKDINLYQAQKALDNAKHAVKDGGIIILVASCSEGLGEKTFEEWLLNADKPQELIDKIKENFKLGGHKAAAISLVLEKSDIYLVSDMEAEFVENIFMKPFSSVNEALKSAYEKLGNRSKVIVVPYGGSVLPAICE